MSYYLLRVHVDGTTMVVVTMVDPSTWIKNVKRYYGDADLVDWGEISYKAYVWLLPLLNIGIDGWRNV